eukprot:308566_1
MSNLLLILATMLPYIAITMCFCCCLSPFFELIKKKCRSDVEYSDLNERDEGEKSTYTPPTKVAEDSSGIKIVTDKNGSTKIQLKSNDGSLNVSGADLAKLLSLSHTFNCDTNGEITFNWDELNLIDELEKELNSENICSPPKKSFVLVYNPNTQHV